MKHLRPTVLLLLAVVVSSLVAVGASAPAGAVTATVYRDVAARNVNEVRAAHDLHKLHRGGCLDTFAQHQARRMARKQVLFHQRLDRVQTRCGMVYVGEAVVAGFGTARGAVRRGLMKSAPHRAILLDPASRRMGVGARKSGGTWYLSVLVAHG